MDPLRWSYKIQVDIEKTEENARNKGFSVMCFEGQSRTLGEPFPLNQIEIKNGEFGSDTRVIVSPSVTQIYLSINDIPSIEELEHIVKHLEEVEQVLNDTVVFGLGETARFGRDTEIPILSVSMLKTQRKLGETFHKALDELQGIFLSEFVRAFVLLTRGEIAYGKKRLEVFLRELTKMERGLIQMAKEQGFKEAKKWEEELNRTLLTSKRFETELALARTPVEINMILKRYWRNILASNQIG